MQSQVCQQPHSSGKGWQNSPSIVWQVKITPPKMLSSLARDFPEHWGGAERTVPGKITWEEHCRRCLSVHVPLYTKKHSYLLDLQWFTLLTCTTSHNIFNSGGAFVPFQAFPWKETAKLLISSMRFCCQPSWKGLWIQHKEMFGCAAKPSGHTARCHAVGPPNSVALSGTSWERCLVNIQISKYAPPICDENFLLRSFHGICDVFKVPLSIDIPVKASTAQRFRFPSPLLNKARSWRPTRFCVKWHLHHLLKRKPNFEN